MKYSGDYIYRIVREYTNMSFLEYRRTFVMQRVIFLLVNTSKPVMEICEELEIPDRSAFYKEFKKRFHMTPVEYRQNSENGKEDSIGCCCD